MSLVDWQPSESIRSKVERRGGAQDAVELPRRDHGVGGDDDEHRGQRGREHARALGHARRPSSPSRSATATLWTVSVVLIAVAASTPPSGASAPAARSTPSSRDGMGSSSPISPVEQTTTSPAETPRTSATFSAVAWVSANPWAPVHALAPPELRTTASTRPSLTTWRDQVTGAASTRLLVKTAAAWWSGPSLTTRARSGAPLALRPAATPGGPEPLGCGHAHDGPPESLAGAAVLPSRFHVAIASSACSAPMRIQSVS